MKPGKNSDGEGPAQYHDGLVIRDPSLLGRSVEELEAMLAALRAKHGAIIDFFMTLDSSAKRIGPIFFTN